MAKQDYYETLDVAQSAGADDIKGAYRKLAMKYHPDRNAGDKAAEQKFKEINEAYGVLSDEEKRAAYDRFGHAAFDGTGAGPGGAAGAGDFGFNFGGGFADIFDEMFGEFGGARSRGAAQQNSRGADLRYNMEITLTEAFAGKQASIRVPSASACDQCSGSGAAKEAVAEVTKENEKAQGHGILQSAAEQRAIAWWRRNAGKASTELWHRRGRTDPASSSRSRRQSGR